MAEERVQRRLAAVVSADVVGYSAMMGRDEAGTLARLKALRAEFLHPKVAEYGGRIVKTTGDGTLIEFPSAVDAVQHAIDVQSGLAERNAAMPEDQKIRLRLGINVGDIIIDGDDIFGDGVNVAARLEAMAEPGGICVSSRVYEYVGDRLGATFDNLGPQQFKNIAEPVLAYRVRVGSNATEATSDPAATGQPLKVPGKPSIAVLPFANMSRDPEQEHFADGITEDIITELSRIRWFFVTARNSSFSFKGQSPDVRQVARELGVRYVLEGSVRKAGNRLRVTAQLIDGDTGNHVWAERYDRELEDIFAVQDEITFAITGRLQPEIDRAECERARSRPPENLGAWELYHRALRLLRQRTKSDLDHARQLFGRALEQDPNFAPALAGMAYCSCEEQFFGYVRHDGKDVIRMAQRAVALDNADAFSHFALSWAYASDGQVEPAIDEARKALEINPSFADAHVVLARPLVHSGRCAEGIQHIEMAIRLSPTDMSLGMWHNIMSAARLYLGEHEACVDYSIKAARMFDSWVPWMLRTSALGHLERHDEAASARRELESRNPGITIARVRDTYWVADQKCRETLLDGLRKAGLPE